MPGRVPAMGSMAPDVAAALGALGEAALDAEAALRGVDGSPASPAPGERRRGSGLKSIGFWTTRQAHRQLHILALDEDRTAESLLNEALALLFAARGLPKLALSQQSEPT